MNRIDNRLSNTIRPLPSRCQSLPIDDNRRIAKTLVHHSNRTINDKNRTSIVDKSQNNNNNNNLVFENLNRKLRSINNGERSRPKKLQTGNVQSQRHFGLAVIYICGGFVMFASYDPIVDFVFNYQTTVKSDRIIAWVWKRNPIPIYADFYVFGVSNPDHFLNGAKPIMREYGPFKFDLYRMRDVFEWGNTTVKFMESYDLVENTERQVIPMDTTIQMINYPLMMAVSAVRKLIRTFYIGFLDPIVSNVVTIAMRASGESIVEQRPASEILIGRKLPLLSLLESMLQPLRDMGLPVPELRYGSFGIRDSSFGFVALIKEAIFGPLETFTETSDGHIASHFVSFKDSRTLGNFKYPCNRVAGSGGMLFGRGVNSPTVAVFNELACRALIFKNKGVEYITGVRTIRYEMDPDSYNMLNSSYKCFCYDRSFADCDGWVNAASCYEGIDMAMSMPHFLYSPLRQRELRGLKPDQEKHGTVLNVEPNLGIPINAAINMQGNIPVEAARWVPALSKMPKCVLPVFWMSMNRRATPVQAGGLFVLLQAMVYGGYGLLFGSFFLGGRQIRRALQIRKLRNES